MLCHAMLWLKKLFRIIIVPLQLYVYCKQTLTICGTQHQHIAAMQVSLNIHLVPVHETTINLSAAK